MGQNNSARNYNNLKAFRMEGSVNCDGNPGQVFPNALLRPQMLQELAPSLQSNMVESHVLYDRNSQTNFEVDDQVFSSSLETGFSNTHGIKRKTEEDYSPFYCAAKRQMMDDRMAAEMNCLYITNESNSYHVNTETFNPDNDINMQFGDVASDDLMQDNGINDKERKEYPVFQFSAPLEEMLKKSNEILPSNILEEICKPCLALVPWTPPLKGESQLPDKQRHKKPSNTGQLSSTSEEMEDEFI